MKTLEELEIDLAAITSRLTMIDAIMVAGRLGVNMVPVFQCNHSGLYFPSDYVKAWGQRYGVGLGPSVVSEALDSEYDVDPPAITPQIRSIEQIMHPVRNCMVQVDLILVPEVTFQSMAAVLVDDDPFMEARGRILRAKQLEHPNGKLRILQAAWERR